MSDYMPLYGSSFSCLASDCPDTCCGGWEIVIDDATKEYYASVKSVLGERLRKALVTDSDGDTVFRLENGRCPFLDSDGLCEIHTALGHEHTSTVCRQYPWFIEEYEQFTEKSLSLSCPAACNIILGSDVSGNYPRVENKSGDEILNVLVKIRNEYLGGFDETLLFGNNCALLCAAAVEAQNEINLIEPEYYLNTDKKPVIDADCLKACLNYMLTDCEILTGRWRELLTVSSVKPLCHERFGEYCRENSVMLNRALGYYTYKYFLKSVNDLDALTCARFIQLSVLAPAALSAATGCDLAEALRLYSKEIEHDTLNPERLSDFLAGQAD